MKPFLILFTALAMAITGYSQTFTPKSTGGGFDVQSGTATGETFICGGQSFDIYTTAKGSQYVIAISKTGSEYPVWLGQVTEHDVEMDGKIYPVHQFSSGTYATFKLNASGYPRAVYLDKN